MHLFRWIAWAAGVFLAIVILPPLAVALLGWRVYADPTKVPPAQAVLVLGASVYQNGSLSPVLRERADAALALYRAGVVKKILVSGDTSSAQHDEVYPVGVYLVNQGVPKSDIFLDYVGVDTYSSLYRAKTVFAVESLIIASQKFHLPRALLVARSLGIRAEGLDAAIPGDRYGENILREIPAIDKALLDLLLRRQLPHASSTSAISGDGLSTWTRTHP